MNAPQALPGRDGSCGAMAAVVGAAGERSVLSQQAYSKGGKLEGNWPELGPISLVLQKTRSLECPTSRESIIDQYYHKLEYFIL